METRTRESWNRLAEVFKAARRLDAPARGSYLDKACGEDAALRAEVERLLAADSQAASFLEAPAVDDVAAPATDPAAEAWLGKTIGQYQICGIIGTGGMGIVYDALQERTQRRVALKIIRPGIATPEMLCRFEYETELLGRLLHPGIAQIYEAGTTDSGFGQQPFFAMERVEGEPLTQYADARQLGTRHRMRLLIKVCDAVQHAHLSGIIHRDLKPANILANAAGEPKILDFGVARATDSDVHATAVRTLTGQLIGTVPYMSPEQVSGDLARLDSRSDVYALGVIGYELLTGRLPYDLNHKSLPEAARVIGHDEPAPLSTIDRRYRGDLDTIFGKALAKDRNERYASASELAADVQRYLRDEPIIARPPSTMYQLRKFAKRHKGVVIALAAGLAVLIIGIVTTSYQAIRARSAEVVAQQEAESAKAVTRFLEGVLVSADPFAHKGADYTVREALDEAAERVDDELVGQPIVEAAVRAAIGNTYRSLGLYAEAKPHLRRAFDLRKTSLGADHPDTLSARDHLGLLFQDRGELSRAEEAYRAVLAKRREVLGPDHEDTAKSMHALALVLHYQGRPAEAVPLAREAVAVYCRNKDTLDKTALYLMNGLGTFLSNSGQDDEAEKVLREVLDGQRRLLGDDHPQTLITTDNLSVWLMHHGQLAEAEALNRAALDGFIEIFGDEHFEALRALNNRGQLLQMLGRVGEAEDVIRRTLALRERVLGADHIDTLGSLNNLSTLLADQGRLAEAESFMRRTVEGVRATLGIDNRYYVLALHNLATALDDQGKRTEAADLYAEALRTVRAVNPDDAATIANIQGYYGTCLARLGQFEEAETHLMASRDSAMRLVGAEHSITRRAMNGLSELYETRDGPVAPAR